MADMTGDSKLLTSKTVPAMQGGASGSGNSGPTGSARTYPKGKGSSQPNPKDFNPMNGGKSTYGLGCK